MIIIFLSKLQNKINTIIEIQIEIEKQKRMNG
jgi:hypothetical protein